MHRECAYPGTNRDLALRRHMDAEASGVVHEAGVAGDDVVAVDAAEAQRIRPVCASIFERDGVPSVVRNKTTPVPRTRRPKRFTTDLFAGRQRCTNSYGGGSRSGDRGSMIASLMRSSSHSPRLHRSRTSRGERQRETQTIMYSFEACSSSLSTESR